MFKIVDRPVESWDIMSRVIGGEFKDPKLMPPKNVAYLRCIQGLDLKTQDTLLRKLLDGTYNWANLNIACEDIKLMNRINMAFTELLNKRWPDDWKQVRKDYASHIPSLRSQWAAPFKALPPVSRKRRSAGEGDSAPERIPHAFRSWVSRILENNQFTSLDTENTFIEGYKNLTLSCYRGSVLDLSFFQPQNISLVLCDPPFGPQAEFKNNPEWNKVGWEREEFTQFIARAATKTTNPNMIFAIKCSFEQYTAVRHAMAHNKINDISPMVVHDVNASDAGGHRYVSACQLVVFGFLGYARTSTWNFGNNPMERHNMLFIKGKKHKSRHENGEVVNPAESPESLAKNIINHHSNPGDTILVACAGSGADAAAALKLGRNVLVVENDQRQFQFIVNRLKSVGTQLQSDIAPSFGAEINYDNLLSQIRVGCQKYYSRLDNMLKDRLTTLSTEELDNAAEILSSEAARRRSVAENAKTLPPTGTGDTQSSTQATAGSVTFDSQEVLLTEGSVGTSTDVDPSLDAPKTLPKLLCKACNEVYESVESCHFCNNSVCESCCMVDDDTGLGYCSVPCRHRAGLPSAVPTTTPSAAAEASDKAN